MANKHYEILGLSSGVGMEEVKQAYYRLAKQWHPDKNIGDVAAEKIFRDINIAYDALKKKSEEKPADFEKNITENYYDILGVSFCASKNEIEEAYHRISAVYLAEQRAGKVITGDRVKLINRAYEVLMDSDEQDPDDW